MSRRKETGRNRITLLSFIHQHFACCASAATWVAFLQLPAFFSSCADGETQPPFHAGGQIYIQWTKNPIPEALDLFFYDTLGAQKLDAYQQIGPMEQPVYAVSGSGPRKLVVLSGRKGALPEGQGMNTYGELCKLSFHLEQEQPDRPLLYGEALLDDGNSRQTTLALLTALCQIRIQSVSCDFSGHPYAASPFRNNRLYILYAGTESRPLGPGDGYPVSWMNTGRLDSLAVAALPYPEMLMQAGAGAIGQERRYLFRDFYCYANPSREASAGRPVTHLVLEGDIGETHCYYPIPLPGMRPATRYVLDLTLLRMGSPDPDIPVESGTYVLNGQVLPWEEADAATVLF